MCKKKILYKTDSKLRRRKLNSTVKIWSTFALMKNQVYNTFRKNSFVRPNVNLIILYKSIEEPTLKQSKFLWKQVKNYIWKSSGLGKVAQVYSKDEA
jgi:hypothetical protein